MAQQWARSTGRGFVLRIDDIDAGRSTPEAADRQLEDLAALGIRWDGPVTYQSQNIDHYRAALQRLAETGLVYECYCSRRDIQQEMRDASRAPHALPGHYPGTCRDLPPAERESRRQDLAAQGRVPAVRLRSQVSQWTARECFASVGGQYTGSVDDLVLRRGGQVTEHEDPSATGYAYNLAVVVDDALAGVDQVVRGDDLLSSAPRQAYLAHLLGMPEVEYVHLPLVLGPSGKRLAKRDGAVTLRELPGETLQQKAEVARKWIRATLGEAWENPVQLSHEPVVWQP